jgi:hypothetical protein
MSRAANTIAALLMVGIERTSRLPPDAAIGVVLGAALVSGGWLMQRGFNDGAPHVYQRARLFDQVMDRVSRNYVEQVDTAQLAEDVELPRLQLVLGEDVPPGTIQMPGQPGNAAEDVQRLHVEVRTFGAPCLDH